MTETTVVPALTPEQEAALYAQFVARQDAEKAAAKVQREKEKAARDERAKALSPVAGPFAVAVYKSTPVKETAASIKAREDDPTATPKFTRGFSTHVVINGERYTLFGYLSKSSKQKDDESAQDRSN